MAIRLLSASIGELIGVLTALLLVSLIYAILLTWLERRFGFVTAYTWLTVVIGVAYTLVGVAVLSVEAAALCLVAFGASSIPIVIRSIVLDLAERNDRLDRLERRGQR